MQQQTPESNNNSNERRKAAREAITTTPGIQRQNAIKNYMGRFEWSLAAQWTLVCEAIALERLNPELIAHDLDASTAASYRDQASLIHDQSLASKTNPLRNVAFRDTAVRLREIALTEILVQEHNSAVQSQDVLKKVEFMYRYANLDVAVNYFANDIRDALKQSGIIIPNGSPQKTINDTIVAYFDKHELTRHTIPIMFAVATAIDIPDPMTVGRRGRVWSTPSEQGEPYVNLLGPHFAQPVTA